MNFVYWNKKTFKWRNLVNQIVAMCVKMLQNSSMRIWKYNYFPFCDNLGPRTACRAVMRYVRCSCNFLLDDDLSQTLFRLLSVYQNCFTVLQYRHLTWVHVHFAAQPTCCNILQLVVPVAEVYLTSVTTDGTMKRLVAGQDGGIASVTLREGRMGPGVACVAHLDDTCIGLSPTMVRADLDGRDVTADFKTTVQTVPLPEPTPDSRRVSGNGNVDEFWHLPTFRRRTSFNCLRGWTWKANNNKLI